jgi:hypothetical protein
MGGDCSQKLCPGEECYSSPGRSRSSDQYEINNSIAKIGCPRTRLLGILFFLPWLRGAASLALGSELQ